MFNATMDFGLGEDIDALRETVRKFALEEIAPKSAEVDTVSYTHLTLPTISRV